MIDHIGFPVSDYQRAKAFYALAPAPLGYSLIMEVRRKQIGAKWQAGFPDRRRRRIEQAAACRDRRQGPHRGRRFLPGGHGGGRTGDNVCIMSIGTRRLNAQ